MNPEHETAPPEPTPAEQAAHRQRTKEMTKAVGLMVWPSIVGFVLLIVAAVIAVAAREPASTSNPTLNIVLMASTALITLGITICFVIGLWRLIKISSR